MVWFGLVWFGLVWFGLVWFGLVWFGLVWFGLVWFGLVWFGLVWFGLVWFGLVWFGLVWFGFVTYPDGWICEMYMGRSLHIYKEHRNLEIRKHVTTSCSGTKPFYYLWVKGFDIRRETQSYYSLFIIWPLSRAVTMARKFVSPQRAPKVEPLRSAFSFNSFNFLQIPKNLHALPVSDVTRTSSPVSSSQTIVTSLSDMSALCERVRYHLQQGCT